MGPGGFVLLLDSLPGRTSSEVEALGPAASAPLSLDIAREKRRPSLPPELIRNFSFYKRFIRIDSRTVGLGK